MAKCGRPREQEPRLTLSDQNPTCLLATNALAGAAPTPIFFALGNGGAQVLVIHLGYEAGTYFFGANGLAFAVHRAVSETFPIHRLHHVQHSIGPLRLALRQERQV